MTPAPLSMAHINGEMCATSKAALVHKLESKIDIVAEGQADLVIIDFMFFLRSLASLLPHTYGGIARFLLHRAASFGSKHIMFVADTYDNVPTIKDLCHEKRAMQNGRPYSKLNHGQTRPGDLHSALKTKSFIIAFIKFLQEQWASERCCDLIEGKVIHFANGPCFTYKVLMS